MLAPTVSRQGGFTLLELLLASGLSGLILTTWISGLTYQMVSLDTRLQTARKTQQFNQLGLWLSQELERARDNGDYAWQWQQGCLLYNDENGVRLNNRTLQWRGGKRSCHQPGWVSLGDPVDFEIIGFSIGESTGDSSHGYLKLTSLIENQQIDWEYRFNGQLLLTP